MKKTLFKLGMLPISMLVFMPAYAATPIDLMNQPVSALAPHFAGSSNTAMLEISRSADVKHTMHVRVQQEYKGYKVWGADAVVHIPNGEKVGRSFTDVVSAAGKTNSFMNGTIYQGLDADLAKAPAQVFEQAQAQKMLSQAIESYQHKIGGQVEISNQASELMVYVDGSNKAHWAYKISFTAASIKAGALPAMPVYIMDAISGQVYSEWNDLKTEDAASVAGGGFGGNKKMGKLVYDGLPKNLSKLFLTRNASSKICLLQNADVTVKNEKTNKVESFKCATTSSTHNNVYWNGAFEAVNGGYSPGNDALFGGYVIKHMYQDWYGVPVLVQPDGKPMMLNMVVHSNMDNAYWDGQQMVFGDGIDDFYPLTSLGVAAHEISHGFTEQHSNLNYSGQSGGMNEAYSDMAAQAAEVYAYGPGKNSWQIGPEIFKAPNEALRYMDMPSKDCGGKAPGNWCSIDDASQYTEYLDVHFSSGVYNRFFYTLGTTTGWDAKKAFDVMVHANSHYWTSTTDFNTGACGVIQAAKDLGEDISAVKAAFDVVKVDYSACKIV